MTTKRQTPPLDLGELGGTLSALGLSGFVEVADFAVRDLLIATKLAVTPSDPLQPSTLLATSHLFELGPTRDETSALRRVLSFEEH
jgi:hypothetical protein